MKFSNVAAALLVTLTAIPQAFAAADAAAGATIARNVCMACHDISPAKPRREQPRTPAVPPAFYTIAQDSSHTAAWLGRLLHMPHGHMDNVVLTQADIDNVSAYILAMRAPTP